MSIHFEADRWDRIRQTYAAWWRGTSTRPLIKMPVPHVYAPSGPPPRAPRLDQSNCHDLRYSPEEIIDAIDYELSQYAFLGDAFPYVSFDVFGPGILAAFCGAQLDNHSGRVWFFPEEIRPIEDIHIVYDPHSCWAERIKAIYRAGQAKWGGQVLLSIPDLGGPLDVAAVFRGSENLLMDLYDAPEEVLRLCGEVRTAWAAAYNDLNSVLQPVNPGYSDWSGAFSDVPAYILQSDFSYMISTPMFDTFTLPSLREATSRLGNSIYHLDGIGQLPHLDSLLRLKALNAVQFVPGDGQPSTRHWIDVFHRIRAAGKSIYLVGDYDDLAAISKQVDGLYFSGWTDSLEAGQAILRAYGVPEYP